MCVSVCACAQLSAEAEHAQFSDIGITRFSSCTHIGQVGIAERRSGLLSSAFGAVVVFCKTCSSEVHLRNLLMKAVCRLASTDEVLQAVLGYSILDARAGRRGSRSAQLWLCKAFYNLALMIMHCAVHASRIASCISVLHARTSVNRTSWRGAHCN